MTPESFRWRVTIFKRCTSYAPAMKWLRALTVASVRPPVRVCVRPSIRNFCECSSYYTTGGNLMKLYPNAWLNALLCIKCPTLIIYRGIGTMYEHFTSSELGRVWYRRITIDLNPHRHKIHVYIWSSGVDGKWVS